MTPTSPIVTIRADASYEIGGGHIVRCLTLANVLTNLGWIVTFAVNSEALSIVPTLRKSGHRLIILEGADGSDPKALIQSAGQSCDLLVVDHYGLDARYESALSEWAALILVIDDLANRPHHAHLLLDQTPGRTAIDYSGRVTKSCRLLMGEAFAVIRPSFSSCRAAALSRQRRRLQRIFVGFGATDTRNMTPLVVEAIAKTGRDFELCVVLGVSAKSIDATRATVASFGLNATIHIQASDVEHLMTSADLAIGACGTSSLERCVVGLPTLGIITSDNQSRIARYLEESGAIHILGCAGGIETSSIANAIETIAEMPETLATMSDAAARICDGYGVNRVAAEIEAMTSKQSSKCVSS